MYVYLYLNRLVWPVGQPTTGHDADFRLRFASALDLHRATAHHRRRCRRGVAVPVVVFGVFCGETTAGWWFYIGKPMDFLWVTMVNSG